MRKLGFSVVLAVAIAMAGCGDDDNGDPSDGGTTTADGARDSATTTVDSGGTPVDAATGGGRGPGELCVSSAPDGGFGACQTGLKCCTSGGSNICTLPEDCPAGGFLPCARLADCPTGICCQTPQMTFCTKRSACASFGGTELP